LFFHISNFHLSPNGQAFSRLAECARIPSLYLTFHRRKRQSRQRAEGQVGCNAMLDGNAYRLSITYNGSSRSFTRVFSISIFSPTNDLILFLFISHRPSVLFSTTCFFAACFFLYHIASSLLTNYPSIFFLSEGLASHTLLLLLASSLYHIQGTSPHIPLLHPLPVSLFGVGLPPISPSALDC
jgi:hypothetical protein